MISNPTSSESDLIDDQALESADQDRFRHADYADELVSLVRHTKTPANIALFGPWGSGKSSLANILETKLRDSPEIDYARFDAFKYAEAPLRRHFLSQLASALDVTDTRFRAGLYESTTRSRISLSWRELGRLLLIFIGVVVAVGLLQFLLGLAGGSVRGSLLGAANATNLASLLGPAALLSAFIALAGKSVQPEVTTGFPSSDEQFERLFNELVKCVVKRKNLDKLVIFIDELDRCAPEEVVSTLETVRTFLGVQPCVFIVAADQQVLEHALRMSARQSTPPDPNNPYYSVGSAYLDKIFQYQLEIPPLRSRRLTDFASNLVKNHGGIWGQIDSDQVVSVLIPTHVRSPRRVKVLLNNFVLAYHVALLRKNDGALAGELAGRACELAKLVCLRTEFPLFARDLAIDSRLPQLVLSADRARDQRAPANVRSDVWQRAAQYAQGLLPMDVPLFQESAVPVRITGVQIESPEDLNPKTGDVAVISGDTPEHSDDPQVGTDKLDTQLFRTVRASHAQQLISYLNKTAYVQDPRDDLIHMESSGPLYGLDSNVALSLEEEAVNGRTPQVLQQISSLDDNERLSALKLLAHIAREASVGLEGENAVSTLLQAIPKVGSDIGPVADSLADSVSFHQRRYELRSDDLPGALELGLRCSRDIGSKLVASVIARDEAVQDTQLGLRILRATADVLESSPDRLGAIAARLLIGHSCKESAAVIADLPSNVAQQLMDVVEQPLLTLYKEEVPASSDVSESEELDRSVTFDQVLSTLLVSGAKTVAEVVLTIGLRVGSRPFRDVVSHQIDSIAPISSPRVAVEFLGAVKMRSIDQWPAWVNVVDPALHKSVEIRGPAEALCLSLWRQGTGGDPPESASVTKALESLVPLLDPENCPIDSLDQLVTSSLTGSMAQVTDLSIFDHTLELAYQFESSALVHLSVVTAAALASIEQVLLSSFTPSQVDSLQAEEYIENWVPRLAAECTAEEADSLFSAAEESTWLTSPLKEIIELRCSARGTALGKNAGTSFGPSEIRNFVEEFSDEFGPGFAIWIRTFAVKPPDVWIPLELWLDRVLPSDVRESLQEFAGRLTQEERFELAQPLLDALFSHNLNFELFDAVRFRI